MKLVCVLFIILSINFDYAMPVDLQCYYANGSWEVVGSIYQCNVQNNLNIISSESAVITEETGSHRNSNNNDDVHGFHAIDTKTEIFPRGLEKIYKNLKLIDIRFGRIKEIHQSDLKPFPQLEFLGLDENDIEILEEGLFDFNPKLTVISFENNIISQIYPDVFEQLTLLTQLWLNGNQCIDKYVKDNSSGVKELIKHAQLQCPSPNHFTFKEVQKLKLNFNDQNLQFKKKLAKVEETCQNSFFDLQTYVQDIKAQKKASDDKFEKLEASTNVSTEEILRKIEKMETKQSNDVEAINLKIQAIKSSEFKSLKKLEDNKNLKVLVDSAHERITKLTNYLKISNNKIDMLEKAVKTNEQSLQNLKTEMFAAFWKILEKLEENAAKIEQRTAPKMDAIMTNLKSQNLAFAALNKKIMNLESGLTTLQSELLQGKKDLDASCDLDPNDDTNEEFLNNVNDFVRFS